MQRSRVSRLGCCPIVSTALATSAGCLQHPRSRASMPLLGLAGEEHNPQLGWAEGPGAERLGALLSPKLSPQHHHVMSPRGTQVCAALV